MEWTKPNQTKNKQTKSHQKYGTVTQRNYTAVNVNCFVHQYGGFSAEEEEPSPQRSIHCNSKGGRKNGIWQGSIYGWETLNKGMVTSAFCGAYLKGGGRGHEAWWLLNNFKDLFVPQTRGTEAASPGRGRRWMILSRAQDPLLLWCHP